ncbi:uncharacterized protein LOC143291187 isoform X3 [Babylonia areolata]|uniref:uncharacterized protein LOC143291187 isoform X3 n=1 Tax=Babylonia areolata TaxID=304850 RepID=UPI003FD07618
MMVLVVLAILLAVSEGCQLPEQLAGHWDSSAPGWKDLTINNTTAFFLHTDVKPLNFSCFINNGSTYVLQSSDLRAIGMTYNYYICLDIVPSDTNKDLVFFRIRTEDNPDHEDLPFETIVSTQEKNLEEICSKPATELPMGFTFFLRKGYKAGNMTCPSSLQAVFAANFTETVDYSKCSQGFMLNGCDRSHVIFNYTQCGSQNGSLGSSGSPNYTCLSSVVNDEVTYTILVLKEDVNTEQPNPYHFACLAQQENEDGSQMMTKNAGTCGGTPSVNMTAVETVSCRPPPPTSTESPTQPGSGNSGSASSWGLLSFLLPAIVAVLAAVSL